MHLAVEPLLQSDWFIRMLDKSSTHPKQRLLNLFIILEDWLSAPFDSIQTKQEQKQDQTKQDQAIKPAPSLAPILQTYLSQQAALAGSKHPEILAHQLYFMALSAGNTYALHAESHSLTHARTAATALIEAELNARTLWKRPKTLGYSALALSATVSIVLGVYLSTPPSKQYNPVMLPPQSTPTYSQAQEASPAETAAIYAKLEMMRHGDCRFIEALQLPERVKSIYIENVIQGRITNNRQEQRIVHELLDQVKCNYTPKLMLNSVS